MAGPANRRPKGRRPGALWWPRGAEPKAWCPRGPQPGGGDSSRGPLLADLAAALSFLQEGSAVAVKPNFCKINKIDRDNGSVKRERRALPPQTHEEEREGAAPGGSAGYCRSGPSSAPRPPAEGAAAGPGRSGGGDARRTRRGTPRLRLPQSRPLRPPLFVCRPRPARGPRRLCRARPVYSHRR